MRLAQRGTWFPLLLFGLAVLASAPIDRYSPYSLTCRSQGAGTICTHYSTWAFVYWPVAFVLAYIAIAAFYVRRSRSRGVGTRVQPYVIAGVIVALALTGLSLWAAHHPPSPAGTFLGIHVQPRSPLRTLRLRLTSPQAAIGLALLVLARVERSWALLLFTVGYLVITLASFGFDSSLTHPSAWFFLPHLLVTAGALLVGSAGFAIAERRGK